MDKHKANYSDIAKLNPKHAGMTKMCFKARKESCEEPDLLYEEQLTRI